MVYIWFFKGFFLKINFERLYFYLRKHKLFCIFDKYFDIFIDKLLYFSRYKLLIKYEVSHEIHKFNYLNNQVILITGGTGSFGAKCKKFRYF